MVIITWLLISRLTTNSRVPPLNSTHAWWVEFMRRHSNMHSILSLSLLWTQLELSWAGKLNVNSHILWYRSIEISSLSCLFSLIPCIEWHIPSLSLHGELGGQLKFASLHSGTQDNSWVPQDECTNKSYPHIELSLSADLGLSMWVGCKSAL